MNQADFLPDAIASVHVQRGAAWEHIIVDPGSTDSSREIAASTAGDRTVLLFEPDTGPSDGLNKGFDRASGDIYGYINADDALEPSALEFVQRWFDAHPTVDVLTGAMRILDQRGSTRWRLRTSVPFSADKYIAGTTTVLQQPTFIRRSAFAATTGFNTDNATTWDAELMVDLDLSGATFGTTHRVLARFRHHDRSLTQRANHPRSELDRSHARAVEADFRRIRAKVTAARGTTPPPAGRIGRSAFVLRPARRFLEVTHLGHHAAGLRR